MKIIKKKKLQIQKIFANFPSTNFNCYCCCFFSYWKCITLSGNLKKKKQLLFNGKDFSFSFFFFANLAKIRDASIDFIYEFQRARMYISTLYYLNIHTNTC